MNNTLEANTSAPQGQKDAIEKVKKFKQHVSKTVSISGFLSITKRLEALFDRVVDAVREGNVSASMRHEELIQSNKEVAASNLILAKSIEEIASSIKLSNSQ